MQQNQISIIFGDFGLQNVMPLDQLQKKVSFVINIRI